jgi:hypothetical protein
MTKVGIFFIKCGDEQVAPLELDLMTESPSTNRPPLRGFQFVNSVGAACL